MSQATESEADVTAQCVQFAKNPQGSPTSRVKAVSR
jgi:hypothetical protein